jgi:hypothetical protein
MNFFEHKIMQKIISLLLILFLYSTTFAQIESLEQTSSTNQFAPTKVETFNDVDYASSRDIFPARGKAERGDWGLALSGGGIRAGFYSIGVMKALYEQGFLDNIDAISSVSGGGYASYWLYTNFLKDFNERKEAAKFGESAFANEYFIRNACALQSKSKVIPGISMLNIIFKSRGKAFRSYMGKLQKTFGNDLPDDKNFNFVKQPQVDAPFFIINTTLRQKGDDRDEPKMRLFEITKDFRGNESLDFKQWTDDDTLMTFSESIAASAAPKWKIAHAVKNYSKNDTKHTKLYLSDGGHFENLGALGLIRRGVKNIIIVDAEEDAHYRFYSYDLLKKYLDKANLTLKIDEIDTFLAKFKDCDKKNKTGGVCDRKKIYENSYSLGAVTVKGDSSQIRSRIIYVKMSKPADIFTNKPTLEEIRLANPDFKEGEEKYSNLCEQENYKYDGDADLYKKLYTYKVLTYDKTLNPRFKKDPVNWTKLKFFSFLSKADPFFTYQFPHITTLDQSFFKDQAEAFIGLGYLQAEKIGNIEDVKFPARKP